MFIAHIPTGYVSSKLLFCKFNQERKTYKSFLWAGIIGAVVPDIDLLYFYLVDHRRHLHHGYVTHWPILWLSLMLISVAWLYHGRAKRVAAFAFIFSLNAFVHMFFDTITGGICWLEPFSQRSFTLATVPTVYKLWWLNFLLHWSFALELAILAWAFFLWRQPVRCREGVA